MCVWPTRAKQSGIMPMLCTYEPGSLVQINWEESQDMFYSQYLKAMKKREFLSLKQHEGVSVAK